MTIKIVAARHLNPSSHLSFCEKKLRSRILITYNSCVTLSSNDLFSAYSNFATRNTSISIYHLHAAHLIALFIGAIPEHFAHDKCDEMENHRRFLQRAEKSQQKIYSYSNQRSD